MCCKNTMQMTSVCMLLMTMFCCLHYQTHAQSSSTDTFDQLKAFYNITQNNISFAIMNQQVVNNTLLTNLLLQMMMSGDYAEMLKDITFSQMIESILFGDFDIQRCAQGTYSLSGATTCTSCAAGKYSLTENASSAMVCTNCPVGTYSTAIAATSATTCTLCSANTFSNVTGASSPSTCRACPANSVSSPGSASSTQCSCLPGYYLDSATGQCLGCPADYWCIGNVRTACPSQSKSVPLSSSPASCKCNPGFYGNVERLGMCWQCLADAYCEGGKDTPTPCPAGSTSSIGSTSIDACKCQTGYEKSLYGSMTRTFTVNIPRCNCTTSSPCGGSACTLTPECPKDQQCGAACDFRVSDCSSFKTPLSCPQGYLQLYSTVGYDANRKQEWWIRPSNGFERINLTFTVLDVDFSDILAVYTCTAYLDDTSCSNPLNSEPLTTMTALRLKNQGRTWFISNTGIMRVTWYASDTLQKLGWKAEYSSSTLTSCGSVRVLNAGGGEIQSPVFVWRGDTVNFQIPSSGNSSVLVVRSENVMDESVNALVAGPAASGVLTVVNPTKQRYFVVDFLYPSRNVEMITLVDEATKWNVLVTEDVAKQQLLLSGDVKGGAATIYMTMGDTLYLSANASQSNMALSLLSSYDVLSGGFTLAETSTWLRGQGTYRISWDTSAATAGWYYYAVLNTLGTAVRRMGRIYVSERSGAQSCRLCQPNEYCYLGQSFQCPAYSSSVAGATDVSECRCNTGYYTEQTNLRGYSRMQTMDSSGKHTCAIVSEAKVLWCWGLSLSGQTGRQDNVVNALPAAVMNNAGVLAGVHMVSLGADFTCVIHGPARNVRCFGGNGFGQLGHQASYASTKSMNVATEVPDTNLGTGTQAEQISCNLYTCCAIVSEAINGDENDRMSTVVCWGDNSRGQLGRGTTGNSVAVGRDTNTMGDYLQALDFNGDRVTNVTVGGTHACAVGMTGVVYCWGDNLYGQLAVGESTSVYNVPKVANLYGTAVAINCNFGVCCAIMELMYVKCWGMGKDPVTGKPNGRLGGGEVDHVGNSLATVGINIPAVEIGERGLVVDVNVGDVQTCVLLDNNHVKCWGLVGGNVIGDQPFVEMFEFLPNLLLSGGGNAIQLGGKGLVQCAVLSSYQLSCWGDNQFNQLGIPESQSPGLQPYVVSATGYLNMSNMTLVPLGTGNVLVKSSGIPFVKMCSICPANFYCDGSGNGNAIEACPANMFSDLFSTSFLACKCNDGYYQDTQGVCQLCPAGFYCRGNAKSPCPLYATSLPGAAFSSDCQCQSGYAGNSMGGCVVCEPGTYKNGSGFGNCSACPAGSFSALAGASSVSACALCPAGKYALAGSSECKPCLPGTFSSPGASVCTVCGDGYYASPNGSVCEPCPQGTYQTPGTGAVGDGAASCMRCSSGQYSTVLAATTDAVCKTCRSGTFSVSGSSGCTLCPTNTFSYAGDICRPCPNASTSVAGSNSTGCMCQAGYFQDSLNVFSEIGFKCSVCPVGQYSLFGAQQCSRCPAGSFQPVTAASSMGACRLCDPGYSSAAGSGSCSPCGGGTFAASTGASVCLSCENGEYANPGSVSCKRCPAGFYGTKALVSVNECDNCPIGFYCNGGAHIQSCPIGTFSEKRNLVNVEQCLPCPANSFCPLPTLKHPCPVGTSSVAGTSNMLGCQCVPGATCSYKKVIEAVINVNVSQAYFKVPEIQQQFLQAIARAASVPLTNVFLTKVLDAKTGLEVCVKTNCRRRNLLAAAAAASATHSQENKDVSVAAASGLHMMVKVLHADELGDLNAHFEANGLDRPSDYAWYAPHHVEVTSR